MKMMGRVKHIHFVGIGGVGMCGIAEILKREGYHISGSDLNDNLTVRRLRDLGVDIKIGHSSENIKGSDTVVVSTAIDQSNPEIKAAIEQKIPVIRRAEMLAELMRFRKGIAIAGTHGKTTTTSLVASLLSEGNLDPTYVIGGKLNSIGANAHLGAGSYLVAEADESDASFLYLQPTIAVVTNIDADHMETYHHNFDELKETFIRFLHHLPFYGLAILCLDDPTVRACIPKISRPILTYGFESDADIQALNWRQEGMKSQFIVRRKNRDDLSITLNIPGRHNVLNTLSAIAIATELAIEDVAIQRALEKFQGVGRRFQISLPLAFEHGKALMVDDYGHHPREMVATLAAARSVWPDRRVILVFQPHRYSRTQEHYADFIAMLKTVDYVLLLDIYSAGEQPIEGVNSLALIGSLKLHDYHTCDYIESVGHLETRLNELVHEGDIILMQGAGSIGQMIPQLIQKYQEE
jgi:UDP-N-acetylmuramate--alanine ligase